MTDTEKLTALKIILNIKSADTAEDARLAVFLESAKAEIIAWRYGTLPESKVPKEYEQVQIWSVVAGYSQSGAENQVSHSENGINRAFKYADMIAYIRAHVRTMVGVL